jgi:hypothetical protein
MSTIIKNIGKGNKLNSEANLPIWTKGRKHQGYQTIISCNPRKWKRTRTHLWRRQRRRLRQFSEEMLQSSGGNRTVYPMHRQASAVSLPMCFLQRFNYSLLPASRFRIGNRTDGHCREVRANDTGHQGTRQQGKVAACSFLICSLTKHEIMQDEMGGTHRMFEGDGMYSDCCQCILIDVYVFLLFVHVFLSLSMYSYCCLCILRRGCPGWGFSVLFPQL